MKINYKLFAFLFLYFFLGKVMASDPTKVLITKPQQKVSFTENKGQVCDQYYKARPDVLFGGTDGELVFHLKNNGISYQLHDQKNLDAKKGSTYRIDINWLNSNSDVKISKEKAFEGYANFYMEHCPNGILNVMSYEQIIYSQIYSGIDLKWYQKDGHLKYDYVVAPGANYKLIQLQINGAEKLLITKEGALVISTPFGDITEAAPIVRQNGKTIKAKWVLNNSVVSFSIEHIDPTQTFIIDPLVRIWGTYYGGAGAEGAEACSTDALNNVYMTGTTNQNSGTVMATVGSHQTTNGGGLDAFLAKFNSAGVRQWSTHYGGAGDEYGYSCPVDAAGNIYMAGVTTTSVGTTIATVGSHQQNYGGGIEDAFLVKFNAAGVRQWGTYYGDTQYETAYSAAIDLAGNVYISGITGSTANISTPGAHQPIYGGGVKDAFLIKFNPAGVRQWGTYYGGTGDDMSYSCAVDVNSNVFLTGETSTNSGTSIATAISHQPINAGGRDAFLAKFNSSGVRQWGTYYGGTSDDLGRRAAIDKLGNIYLPGNTQTVGGTVIATVGSHQPNYGGGTFDAFLVKFNTSGVRQWGTYYGDANGDFAWSCSVDTINNFVYIGGYSGSTSNIGTANAHQPNCAGSMDGMLVQFDLNGVRQMGTYYGGSLYDTGWHTAVDLAGSVYLAGYAYSNTGTDIATTNGHQPIYGGGVDTDAFLVKFSDCNLPPSPTNSTPPNGQLICAGSNATLSATGTGTLSWFNTATGGSAIGTGTNFVTSTLPIGTYSFYVESVTCAPSNSRTVITLTVSDCLGITPNEFKDQHLLIYPNPSDGKFYVQCTFSSQITITDLLGNNVLEKQLEAGNQKIELRSLPTGVYFVRSINGNDIIVKKVIINR